MPKTSLCRCPLYCTTFNPTTGKYEGPGKIVPHSTKGNHTKDSRVFISSPIQRSPSLQPSLGWPINHKMQVISEVLKEFRWLSSWPVSSTNQPLVFQNDPNLNGPYERPLLEDIQRANTGKYSLKSNSQINENFLAAESGYCNMVGKLNQLEPDFEQNLVLETIRNELIYINRQKGLAWSQQRGEDRTFSTNGAVTVNTG